MKIIKDFNQKIMVENLPQEPLIKQGWLRAIVYIFIAIGCSLIVAAPFYKLLHDMGEGTFRTIYEEI